MSDNKPLIHIVGAGMAGLAAAVRCLELGLRVRLHESANHAGGRCRSFYEAALERTLDNGNHLILGGNPGLFEYLRTVGSNHRLAPGDIAFPFIDLATGERWTLRPGSSKLPLWLLLPGRRVPGTRFKDYALMRGLAGRTDDPPLGDLVDRDSTIFTRFWEPLCAAVLNTDAAAGSSRLIGRMLELTLLRSPMFARPYFVPEGLSATLVDPGLAYIESRGGTVSLGSRLGALALGDQRVTSLSAGGEEIELGRGDGLILAVPPGEAGNMVPELTVPTEYRPIVNVHYRVEGDLVLPGKVPFLGVIGGTAHWLFQRDDVISVTVSAAQSLAEAPAGEIAREIWSEIADITDAKGTALPANRVIKEKRATIAQTPAQNLLRPDSATRWENLFLAGDWTDTGLPATIEGAVRSGQKAAELLAKQAPALIKR